MLRGNRGAALVLIAPAFLPLTLGVAPASPPAVPPSETAPQRGDLQPGIELLIERVQSRHQRLRDLEARFVQRRLSRVGGVIVENRGRMFVRLPGRMRWEYEDPEQLFVTAGGEMYFYLPADNQVQIFAAEESETSRTPIMYLAGKGNLVGDFEIEATEWGPKLAPGNVQVRLLPRQQDASFTSLVLEIEPMSATIARLVKFDLLNNTIDYQFYDVEFDVGLPDSLFEFDIPQGTAVMYIGSRS